MTSFFRTPDSLPARSKRWVRFAGVAAVVLALGFLLFRLYPLQWIDGWDRLKLRWHGVQSMESPAGDRGVAYTPRECRGETAGCTCVVLVHGIGDSVLTWRKILTRRDWLKGVTRPVKLMAWDLPGHGNTPEPPKNPDGELQLRAQAMAQRLLGATQSQGCGADTIWVGNSLGGWVSTWVALKRPDQVKALILLAPAGLESQVSTAEAITERLAQPSVESLKEFRKRAYATAQPEYSEWIWQAAVARLRRSPVHRIRQAQLPEDTLQLQLGRVRVPVQILWGKQDRVLPLENSRGFRELAPAPLETFTELDGCGHLPQKECPEATTRAIVQALQN